VKKFRDPRILAFETSWNFVDIADVSAIIHLFRLRCSQHFRYIHSVKRGGGGGGLPQGAGGYGSVSIFLSNRLFSNIFKRNDC